MISGQTLYSDAVEEGLFLVTNSIETVQIAETTEATTAANDAEITANQSHLDLTGKFARLKKSMRKRSVSIF